MALLIKTRGHHWSHETHRIFPYDFNTSEIKIPSQDLEDHPNIVNILGTVRK